MKCNRAMRGVLEFSKYISLTFLHCVFSNEGMRLVVGGVNRGEWMRPGWRSPAWSLSKG